MKKHYTFPLMLIVIFSTILLHAQREIKEWAPKGANWIYWKKTFSTDYYAVRIAHDRDTLIGKRSYKRFDVYDLHIYALPPAQRWEKWIGSYFVGINGDTVFQYFDNKEVYYVDKNKLGEKIYPFKQCDPSDTTWARLDTVYYKNWFDFQVKYMVYSNSRVSYKKDTLRDVMPLKIGMCDNSLDALDEFHCLVYSKKFNCHDTSDILGKVSQFPDLLVCYYDPIIGNMDLGYGMCYLRDLAKMSNLNSYGSDIAIIPNPSSHTIRIMTKEDKDLMYFIYDSQGHIVDKGDLVLDKDISIQNLSSGSYYLSVQKDSQVIGVKKFIKL